MDFHFSQDTLRQNLEVLANRQAPDGFVDASGRVICAEARFEVDNTALRLAYLAHLCQQPTD